MCIWSICPNTFENDCELGRGWGGSYLHILYTPSLQEFSWLPMEQLLLFRDTIMAYKCFTSLAPRYLTNKFVKRSQFHNRHTQNCDSLEIPAFKRSSGQRIFSYRAVKTWSNLDNELKQITTVDKFKKKLKQQLSKTVL